MNAGLSLLLSRQKKKLYDVDKSKKENEWKCLAVQ